MDDLTEASNHIHTLRAQIAATETQLGTLKLQLQQAEHPSLPPTTEPLSPPQTGIPAEWTNATLPALQENVQRDIAQRLRQERGLEDAPTIQAASQRRRWPLATHEYSRYGRQLIMPEIGLRGQLHLKNARVLIVGLGGLGCPAAAYLAGAGVGTLGLVDGDTVEESNLHRQLAHATARVGWNKAESAKAYLSSYVHVDPPLTATRLVERDAHAEMCRVDLMEMCGTTSTSATSGLKARLSILATTMSCWTVQTTRPLAI